MRTGHTFRDLPEQGLLNFDKLRRIHDVQNLLDLAEEHHLFLRARFRPKLEQPPNDGLGQYGILLQELDDTVGELRMVQRQALDLVQRQQHLDKELLVFRLERQRKTIDYATQKRVILIYFLFLHFKES